MSLEWGHGRPFAVLAAIPPRSDALPHRRGGSGAAPGGARSRRRVPRSRRGGAVPAAHTTTPATSAGPNRTQPNNPHELVDRFGGLRHATGTGPADTPAKNSARTSGNWSGA